MKQIVFLLIFFICFPAYAEAITVVHPSWTDVLLFKENNKICRSHNNDCATIKKRTPDIITLKWENWGEETFIRQNDFYVLSDGQNLIEEEYSELEYTLESPYIKLNPYGTAPLTALVKFKTDKPARISWTVKGLNGSTDITSPPSPLSTEHSLTVFMLYPGTKNNVLLNATFNDKTRQTVSIDIQTQKIKKKKLIIPIIREQSNPYYYYHFDGDITDEDGFIRYTFSTTHIVYLINNEIIVENRAYGLTRYALSGKKLQSYPYPKGFLSFEHGIGVTPTGNFLVIGSFNGTMARIDGNIFETHRDIILEIDKKSGEILKKWDLANLMNPDRSVIVKSSERDFGKIDWCHMNSVQYDTDDDSLVVSCRHTGMLKIGYHSGDLKWLFGPNVEYHKSGRDGKGKSISDKVLTAVQTINGKQEPLPLKIQQGYKKHPNFKWPTKTHDAKAIGNNLYSIFDNSGEIYDKSIATSKNSHASIFKIDPVKKTIEHIWHMPLNGHSPAGSGVTYDQKTQSVTVFLSQEKDKNTDMDIGHLIRYDFKTKKKLFETKIYTPYWIYRIEPIDIPSLLKKETLNTP